MRVEFKCKKCKEIFIVEIDKLGHCPHCGKFGDVELIRVVK